jgi:hypothetical protein
MRVACMRVARSQVAVAPAEAPKADPAVAVGVRRPVVAVEVRPAVVPTVAARKVAGAVVLQAAIPTVAAQTVAEAVGLLAVDLPVVALPVVALLVDLPKAVQRAAAGEGARPAPEAAGAAARREGVVREAVPAVRFWSPLLQVVEEEGVVVRTVAAASRRIRLADSILGVSGSSRWSPS